jgi:branched-chain amino acid transport system ATP-binding protein
MAEPKVILLDEPSMGLSPAMVDTVMDAIGEIAATGLGILMVEQNAMAALQVARRAVVLERGSIVLTGSADEIRHHPDVVKAFLGERVVGKPAAKGGIADASRAGAGPA